MKPTISIIIPCYNCQDTLEEAVDSCFVQGLKNFEIIMVNDRSTDETKKVMQKLANLHSEIKVFFHDRNKGGGATRNTAVGHSIADIIFCLDSDDILPENTLSKMYGYLQEKKCDGVAIHKSIKFKGVNVNDIETINTFGYVGEKIPFESLLQKGGILCPLYSVFMFTKRAFQITGGYPTEHGFDTQGFAWRFLMNGLIAYTCPNATYLHRINFHPSYYIREYNAGKINYNWQLVLEEFIFAFSPEVQELIINFDLSDTDNILINKLAEIDNPWNKNIEDIVKFNSVKLYFKKPNLGISERLYLNMCKNNKKSFKGIARNSIRGFTKRVSGKIFNYYKTAIGVIRARDFNFILLLAFVILKIKKFFKFDFFVKERDENVIDIVIPTILKDESLLSQMIEALKVNVYHKINNIYIVSKNGQEIRDFCTKNGFIFVDELSVVGYGKNSISYTVNGEDRSGWIFQQLLKLSGHLFVSQKDYLIVDSDTLLIQPHIFIKNDKYIFLESEEWHSQYFKAFKKIFNYSSDNVLSYTSHMMIFNCDKLKEMKKEMEDLHKMPWDKVYLSTIDTNESSCVSDYDTYANWMRKNYPDKVIFYPFYNKALPKEKLLPLKLLVQLYGSKYKSLSFHHYKK